MAKKRGQGEGSIYQRADGLWCGSISLGTGPDGSRKRKTVTHTTKTGALAKLRALQSEIEQGVEQAETGKNTTVATLCAEWLETVVKPSCRFKTHLAYEGDCRLHIVPHLGRVRVRELDARQVQRLLAHLAKPPPLGPGLSPKSIGNVRGTLRRALSQAMRWDWVSRNVVGLTEPPPPAPKQPVEFGDDQARELLAAFGTHQNGDVMLVMLALGLRLGEALGLRHRDIVRDAESRPVAVRILVQLQHLPSETPGKRGPRTPSLQPPKSAAGRRTIALPRIAQDAIVRALEREVGREAVGRDRLTERAAWAADNGLLFRTVDGTAHSAESIRQQFYRLLARHGMDRIRPHDLRHLCATILVAAGTPLRVVADILGHAQVSLTADTYAHVLPLSQRAAASALDDAMS